MRIEQLYIFQKTAETGSVRKASELLYTSPQNASKAILQLEKEWNTTLFHRSHSGVKLTHEGELAYKMTLKVLEDIAEINSHFHVPTPADL